jgi:hypothetical protein
MKMIVPLLALGLLAGCDAAGKITPESVIAEIKKDCGIVTSVADIASLITHEPTIVTAAGFANLVCENFKSQQPKGAAPGAELSGVLSVNGVAVHYVMQ